MGKAIGGDAVVLADIARRAGEFGRAAAYVAAGLAQAEAPARVTKLLKLERRLIDTRDVSRHSIDEAASCI